MPYRGTSSQLKRKLIKMGLMDDVCADCGIGPVWNGKPLTLQLDHVNGNHCDNRFENLRILCHNCHTQTPTHSRVSSQHQFRKITDISVEEIERESDDALTVTELAERLNLNTRSRIVRDILTDFV